MNKEKLLEWYNKMINQDNSCLLRFLREIPHAELKKAITEDQWLELCQKVIEKDTCYLADFLEQIPYHITLSNGIQKIISDHQSKDKKLSSLLRLTDNSDIRDKIYHLNLMLKSGYNNGDKEQKSELRLLLNKAMTDPLFLKTLSLQDKEVAENIIDAIQNDVLLKKGMYYDESMRELYRNGTSIIKLLRIHADKNNDTTEIEPNIIIKNPWGDVNIATMSDLLFVVKFAPKLLEDIKLPYSLKTKLQNDHKEFAGIENDKNLNYINNEMKTLLNKNDIDTSHYVDIKYVSGLYDKIKPKDPTWKPMNDTGIIDIVNNEIKNYDENDKKTISDKILQKDNLQKLSIIGKYCDGQQFKDIIQTAIASAASSKDCSANIGILLDNELKKLQFNGDLPASKFHELMSPVLFSIFNSGGDVIRSNGNLNNSHIKTNKYHVDMNHLLYNIGLKTKITPSKTDQCYSSISGDYNNPIMKIGAEYLLSMINKDEDKNLPIYSKLTGIVESINDKIKSFRQNNLDKYTEQHLEDINKVSGNKKTTPKKHITGSLDNISNFDPYFDQQFDKTIKQKIKENALLSKENNKILDQKYKDGKQAVIVDENTEIQKEQKERFFRSLFQNKYPGLDPNEENPNEKKDIFDNNGNPIIRRTVSDGDLAKIGKTSLLKL